MTLEIIFLIIGGYVQKKEDNIASVFLFLQFFFFHYFLCNFFLAFILIHIIFIYIDKLFRQYYIFFHAFDIYIFEF